MEEKRENYMKNSEENKENIVKIQKKGKLNSEMISKIWKKIGKLYVKYGRHAR